MKQALRLLILALFAATALAAENEPAGLAELRTQAESGNTEAQLELGILYEYGYRMPDHLVSALAWYMHAADAGSAGAAKRRDMLIARMKPAEVEKAKRLAAELPARKTEAAPAAEKPVEPAAPAAAEKPAEPASSPAPMSSEKPADTAPPAPNTTTSKPADMPAAPASPKPPASNAPAAPAPAPDTKQLF